ncbi:hypothetical protein COCCADRAFT_106589, partial [Bipolaris zeicola 26-R-13]
PCFGRPRSEAKPPHQSMPSTPPRIAIICLWLELAEEIASQISSQFQVNGEHALSHWNALIWKEYRSLVVCSRHL